MESSSSVMTPSSSSSSSPGSNSREPGRTSSGTSSKTTSKSIVSLVVKASNQQFEDQTIECQITWSVRKLKEHLAEVYPSKPRIDEQKLIYAGQLLTDKLILKDVLRTYEGVQSLNHTMHLVYTPKMRASSSNAPSYGKQMPASSSSLFAGNNSSNINASYSGTDGLRQRNVHRNILQETSSIPQSAPMPSRDLSSANLSSTSMMNSNSNTTTSINATTNLAFGANLFQQVLNSSGGSDILAGSLCPDTSFSNDRGDMRGPSGDYYMAQQIAMQNWVQQAYMQYMNQYMNMMSAGISPESIYMQNQPNILPQQNSINAGLFQTLNFSPQNNFAFMNGNTPNIIPTRGPEMNPNASGGDSTIVTSAAAASVAGTSNAAAAGTATAGATTVGVAAPQQQVQNEQQQPQPRFPNFVQEDTQENRDWLDTFYSFSRLMVLLTLVYFYSSPLRCLVVIFIGLTIYLYHIGFFRGANEANNNNNNNNINNNNAQRQNQQERPQERNIIDPAIVAQQNDNNNNNNNHNDDAVQHRPVEHDESVSEESVNPILTDISDNNGTSIIAFIRTFVVSFFVSLLPESPAL